MAEKMNKNKILKKVEKSKQINNTIIEKKKKEKIPMHILIYDIISKTSI